MNVCLEKLASSYVNLLTKGVNMFSNTQKTKEQGKAKEQGRLIV